MRTAIRVTAAAAVTGRRGGAASPAFASASSPADAGRPRRVRADRQHRGQPCRGLPAGGRWHADPGRQLRHRRSRRHLAGSVVDHTASQGSLAYDASNGLLYAVNAGSNTISVFAVRGDRLALREGLDSAGRPQSAWPSAATWCMCSTR